MRKSISVNCKDDAGKLSRYALPNGLSQPLIDLGPRARSGMNAVMARGCFHVWGGEGPAGMFPDHDYYDSRSNQWIRLLDMPIPVHGVYASAFVDGLIWAPAAARGLAAASAACITRSSFRQ